MDFLSKKFITNFDTVSFFFEFEKKISKEEQELIILLLNEFEKNKLSCNFKMDISQCLNYFKEKNIKFILQLIDTFLHKSFNFHFYNKESNTLLIKGSFNLINSISYNEDFIIFNMANELLEAYNKDSIFNKVHLNTLIKFRLESSIKLYLKLIKSFDRQGEFQIPLNTLKKLFNSENSYDRFYDFEKNILNEAVFEINKFSEYYLKYEKVKLGSGKTNRIVGINFKFQNKILTRIKKEANDLMGLIKENVNNFDLVLEKLHEYLQNNSYKYVKENVLYAFEHFNGNFDIFLLEALKNNYVENHFKIKTSLADEEEELLLNFSKYFSNIFRLESELYKQLSKLKFHYDFEFVSVLHQLKSKNKLEFENDKIKIFVEFNKNSQSHIKIYKRLN